LEKIASLRIIFFGGFVLSFFFPKQQTTISQNHSFSYNNNNNTNNNNSINIMTDSMFHSSQAMVDFEDEVDDGDNGGATEGVSVTRMEDVNDDSLSSPYASSDDGRDANSSSAKRKEPGASPEGAAAGGSSPKRAKSDPATSALDSDVVMGTLDEGKASAPTPVDSTQVMGTLLDGTAEAPKEESLRTNSRGTRCHALVCGDVEAKTHTSLKKEGSSFDTCKVKLLFGMIDPSPSGAEYDEKKKAMIFRVPEPFAYDRAKAANDGKEGGISVENYIDREIPVHKMHFVKVNNKKSLPGVRIGSIVKVEGLQCTNRVWQGKVFVDFVATNITPVEGIGCDGSAMVEFLRRTWPSENIWIEEPPSVTEEEVKKRLKSRLGDQPIVLPICAEDDTEKFGSLFKFTQEKGVLAVTRNIFGEPSRFFKLPQKTYDELKEEKNTNPAIEIPRSSNARYSDCLQFSIRASWNIVVQQWDISKSEAMRGGGTNSERRQHFEVMVSAYGTSGLESLGASYPPHWAILSHHIPMMDGMIVGVPNTVRTTSTQGNVERNASLGIAKANGAPEESAKLGKAMRMIIDLKCLSAVIDTEAYLRRYALRCPFAEAVKILGCGDPSAQRIILPKQHGEEPVRKYRDNTPYYETVKLDKEMKNIMCLNMTKRCNGNMVTINKEYAEGGVYYILIPTAIIPDIKRDPERPNQPIALITARAKAASEWVDKIAPEEVLRICTEGVKTIANFEALKSEWAKADPEAEPSKHAAGKWMSYHRLADYPDEPDKEDPPCLVYAIKKQDESVVKAKRATLDACVDSWFHGPGGVYCQKRPGYTLRNPMPKEEEKDDGF
jgi:hypothetical protein